MTGAVDAVGMQGITKAFGSVQALRGADFSLAQGEIHALLGENGAGKTTLMHVLFGLHRPDGGTIAAFGRPLRPGSPRAAMNAGIGLVHQHFSQVPRMTVAENVWLGHSGFRYDRRAASAAVLRIGSDAGLLLDPEARAEDLPIGLRQRLEILKALAREARVLILDEPTASLAPSEVADVFASLRRLTAKGLAVVLITHKLRDVLAIADRVTVLRQGKVVASDRTVPFTAASLATAMIGDSETPAPLPELAASPPSTDMTASSALAVLEVRHVSVAGRIRGVPAACDVSLDVRRCEVVGIAAVEGNGQRELMRAVAGLERFEGAITVGYEATVGFVPEDRQHEGLILDFSITENIALAESHGFWMKRRYLEDRAVLAIEQFGIKTPNAQLPVRALSGGNQQKVVLARVLGRKPTLLVAENPTRGLDIRATADVHLALRRAARNEGLGVLFYSTDLDEVLAVSDRIGVMAAGRWTWVTDGERTRERLGALMLGAGG